MVQHSMSSLNITRQGSSMNRAMIIVLESGKISSIHLSNSVELLTMLGAIYTAMLLCLVATYVGEASSPATASAFLIVLDIVRLFNMKNNITSPNSFHNSYHQSLWVMLLPIIICALTDMR